MKESDRQSEIKKGPLLQIYELPGSMGRVDKVDSSRLICPAATILGKSRLPTGGQIKSESARQDKHYCTQNPLILQLAYIYIEHDVMCYTYRNLESQL